jgi:branched-chain amino acid transport system ATP-binding protein
VTTGRPRVLENHGGPRTPPPSHEEVLVPTEAPAGALLQTRSLTKEFRGFTAVSQVSLSVAEGSIHALVGPNGAGKTTLFNLLTGFLAPTSGTIMYAGQDITGLQPEQIAHRGIARSFQITSLFDQMSLVDHVELALASPTGLGYRFWRSAKQMRQFRPRAMELLAQVGLADRSGVFAGSLAYGEKRALELALALALDPRLLLLDEPTAGMGLEDVERTIDLVKKVSDGRTVVFVDHNMHVVGSLADRVTVLQAGQVLAEGTYDQVRNDERVITAYLGEAHV